MKPVSRQVKYQRKKRAEGLCTQCGGKKPDARVLCAACRKKNRKLGRKWYSENKDYHLKTMVEWRKKNPNYHIEYNAMLKSKGLK